MVSEHGIKLAVYLINSYFGPTVSKVCDCLLRRGTLTLPMIIRFTELTRQNVVNSLLVLIQHNCVQAFSLQQDGGFGEAPKILTQYMVLFDNIIHHMRFPKFMVIVTEELGKGCEEIFEGLLQHGRLSMNQIMDRHKDMLNQGEGNSTALDTLHENFSKLVHSRFIERCPAHEPFLAPPTEDETPAKKRGAKSAKTIEESTVEARALAAAAPMESLRFLPDSSDTLDDVPGEASNENSTNVIPGEKRKKNLETDADVWATNDKKEVLWRANFEEFVRRLRHKLCIANVRGRLDDGASTVLSAILEATRSGETKVKTESSVPLSVDNIFDEVIKSEEGRSMNVERVRASLVQLGCQNPTIGLDDTYSIDLKKIIELAQTHEVESIVLKKYGREAYRIFRLLSTSGRLLETDKISSTIFVEKKDTIKLLYQLWKDDYVHMEKISLPGVRPPDFLLWKVNKSSVWIHVLDDLYHAALNLRLRMAFELEQEKELLLIPVDKRVGELAERHKRLRKNLRLYFPTNLHMSHECLSQIFTNAFKEFTEMSPRLKFVELDSVSPVPLHSVRILSKLFVALTLRFDETEERVRYLKVNAKRVLQVFDLG